MTTTRYIPNTPLDPPSNYGVSSEDFSIIGRYLGGEVWRAYSQDPYVESQIKNALMVSKYMEDGWEVSRTKQFFETVRVPDMIASAVAVMGQTALAIAAVIVIKNTPSLLREFKSEKYPEKYFSAFGSTFALARKQAGVEDRPFSEYWRGYVDVVNTLATTHYGADLCNSIPRYAPAVMRIVDKYDSGVLPETRRLIQLGLDFEQIDLVLKNEIDAETAVAAITGVAT